MAVSVRPLRRGDVATSARLHRQVLEMEFLARCGAGFLRSYHRAWVDSLDGIALAAVDQNGEVVGVLLGAVRPESHFRAMVRRHRRKLAFWMVVRALISPRFAQELVTTRGVRYARGLFRMLGTSVRHTGRAVALLLRGTKGANPTDNATTASAAMRTGEVTHVMVRPEAQGKGVGRALLDAAGNIARTAGLDELVLVTPPELAAGRFYEHLGWQRAGELKSRSGEVFVRYCL